MAEVARFLACAESAQWRLLITDQQGVLYDYARTTYRPPAELRRFLQARDRTPPLPRLQPARPALRGRPPRTLDRRRHHRDEHNMRMLSGGHHHATDDHGWAPTRQPDGSTDRRSPTRHQSGRRHRGGP